MPRVLLITGDEALTRLVSWILTEKRQFEISACESVDDALGQIDRLRPDVVLLNEAAGEQMTRDAERVLMASPDLRIIELYQTAATPGDVRARAVNPLHQPFAADDLIECIEQALARQNTA